MPVSLRALLLVALAMPLVAGCQSSPATSPDPVASDAPTEIKAAADESLPQSAEPAPPAIDDALGQPSAESAKEGAAPEPPQSP